MCQISACTSIVTKIIKHIVFISVVDFPIDWNEKQTGCPKCFEWNVLRNIKLSFSFTQLNTAIFDRYAADSVKTFKIWTKTAKIFLKIYFCLEEVKVI